MCSINVEDHNKSTFYIMYQLLKERLFSGINKVTFELHVKKHKKGLMRDKIK